MTVPVGDERAVRIPARDSTEVELDARFRAAASRAGGGAVIAPPHPLHGGEMGHAVVRALCELLAGADHFFGRGTAELRRALEGLVADRVPGP